MPDQGTPMTRRQIEEKIIALAWKDPEFRREFLADPKGQFEARLGTKLPEPLKMTAHEETENSIHFVIPMKPPATLGELSDEDLEKVAGGGREFWEGVISFGTSFITLPIVTVGNAINLAVKKGGGSGWD